MAGCVNILSPISDLLVMSLPTTRQKNFEVNLW